LLDLKVTKFPAFAAFTTEEKGIGVVVVLNVGNELRKFGVVECRSQLKHQVSQAICCDCVSVRIAMRKPPMATHPDDDGEACSSA
jgi:hypothetical protein